LLFVATEQIFFPLENYYVYIDLCIDNNKTKQWLIQRDGVKILFAYEPEKPIIDA
jgi:hypothetical protein